jgi:hypothetical protein
VNDPTGFRSVGGVVAHAVAMLVLAACLAPAVRAADEFAISGKVDGLFPGANATLYARVTNPYPFTIRVVSTTATVHDASAACQASMLEIGDLTATVEISPGGEGTVPLDVRMDLAAPDACQGATWPLEFSGTAVGAAPSGLPGTSVIGPTGVAGLVAIGAVLVAVGLLALVRKRLHRPRRAAP